MKKLFYLVATVALAALAFAGCTKDAGEPAVVPPTIEEVSGIESAYTRGLHEYLEISPEVALSNDNEAGVAYEWNIDYKVVGTEKTLRIKCDELLSDAVCYFKASSETGAKIIDFTLNVTSPYDKGLLLLSQTSDGAMLTFKRLDILSTPASPYAFKDNNPTLALGKEALSIAWRGDGLTNFGRAIEDGDLDIVISTANPAKIYDINPDDNMKVRNEIVYNGTGEFVPSFALCPAGGQPCQQLMDGPVYWLGNGTEYIMTGQYEFVKATDGFGLPDGANIAPMGCSLIEDDMARVYFDTTTKHLLWMSALVGTNEGTATLDIDEPMNILACDGIYRDESNASYRYEPFHVLVIGKRGNSTHLYRFYGGEFFMSEELLGDMDTTGNILPTSATAVNPISPILYYSKGGDVYRCNYDNESGAGFDAAPYISLGANYEIKQMIFNRYDADTIYIAAEDTEAEGEMKASLFIYNVADKTAAKLLFEDHNIGGSIKQLIYKGNGKESVERRENQSMLKRLFR